MEIDKSNMRKTILDFPRQFKIGLEAAENIKVRGKFDSILVCGVGGSALPADILSMWLEAYGIDSPLYIHSDYGLPYFADKNHLVICISYSGNTEETLSAFEEARKKNFKIAAVTSGGKLAELCKKYKAPAAIIPQGLQPRMALGLQSAALIKILVNCGILKDGLEDILALGKSLKPMALETQGKKIAKKLEGKIPIIYASKRLKYLARIWKIKFNENSKIPAFYNYFPELNHNEMVGFTQKGEQFSVLILKDLADHPRIQKRINLTVKILRKRGVGIDIIDIKGKNILYKIFSNSLLADWASYYLALEYKTDPTPVKIVEEFKAGMAK